MAQRTHPHAEATYRVVPSDDGAFAVEVDIPESYPTRVSPFATKAAAEAWITEHRRRVQSENAWRPLDRNDLVFMVCSIGSTAWSSDFATWTRHRIPGAWSSVRISRFRDGFARDSPPSASSALLGGQNEKRRGPDEP